MTMQPLLVAAEDELSCTVLRKLVSTSQPTFLVSREIITRGNDQLKKSIEKFKSASHVLPHIVLTDLDQYPCPPALIQDWDAGGLSSRLMFRIAVREVEAWLLADRQGIADFLRVALNKIPHTPESEMNPKRTLLNLARKSRSRRLAQELVPEIGSAATIGPLYNARLSEFVSESWNIEQACELAPSLARTVSRLSTFMRE